nr:hypothetical protein [Tanacetum cinerariifolium]
MDEDIIVRRSAVKPDGSAHRLYLSSTSSTIIVDDEQIPILKQFKSDDSGIEIAKELLPADSIGATAGTHENLLMVDKIRTKRGGITHHVVVRNVRRVISIASMAAFGVTHATVLWTTLYRLEIKVSDDTAQTVVVMFDETERAVVKCSAGLIVGSNKHVYFPHPTHVYTYGY